MTQGIRTFCPKRTRH